jgi:hypothetical protein
MCILQNFEEEQFQMDAENYYREKERELRIEKEGYDHILIQDAENIIASQMNQSLEELRIFDMEKQYNHITEWDVIKSITEVV